MQNNDDTQHNDRDRDTTPDDTTPDDMIPEDMIPEDMIPEDMIPEQDPWAALDDVADAADPSSIGERTSIDDGRFEATDMPLAVFPPVDAESGGFETESPRVDDHADDHADDHVDDRADIIPIIENASRSDGDGPDGFDSGAPASLGIEPTAFDDDELLRELGTRDPDAEAGTAAETDNHLPAEAEMESPVASDGWPEAEIRDELQGMPFAADSLVEEHGASIPESIPESIPLAEGVLASAAMSSGPEKPAAASGRGRKKSSGIGQLVGVTLGGVMALPITYAILIWGFHKDPFQLGKQVPEQLAGLLPQKLQPGYKPPRKQDAKPNLASAPSLDDLATTVDTAPPSEETAAAPAAEPAAPAAVAVEGGQPGEPMTEPPAAADAAVAADPVEPAVPAAMLTAQSSQPAADAPAAPVAAPKEPALDAPVSIAAVPMTDVLPGLDTLVADAAAVAAPAAVASLPPLDLSAVDQAAARVVASLQALESVADVADPARDRLLVSWYRRLARMGEELVKLETAAADSGRPLSPLPLAAADILDGICIRDESVQDLDRLGPMWLSRQKRRDNGVVLVATLDGSRQVGPYWSTRLIVDGPPSGGDDRSITVISRLAPPASDGDRVVVSGVMFDGDSVWAADIRPIVPPVEPAADAAAAGDDAAAAGTDDARL